MDRDFLIDLFADFGPVTIRPMFSGFGISADGINFRDGAPGRAIFSRGRADHSRNSRRRARSRFQLSNPRQDRDGQFLLAIAGTRLYRRLPKI